MALENEKYNNEMKPDVCSQIDSRQKRPMVFH